jgi:predicted AAA+ superfamily ATPase
MTMREILGRVKVSTSFIERVQAGNLADFAGANPPVDINGYVSLALQSGYPDVVLNRQANTAAWLSSYVEELVRRDAELVRNGIDTHRFAAYLEAVAAVTAGVVDETTILDATRVDRRTAHAYWAVLENLFIAEEVPAWWSSRLTRLVATGKKYLIDAGLAASILRLTPTSVAQDINWVGRLLDTFVAAQIRPEAALSPSRPRLHHLRTKAGRQEIDLLLEFGGGQVVAIEVKATAAPDIYGSRHLQWLRDQLGDRFTMGLVLHTGPYNFQLDDRIVAAPISTLWA